MNQRLKDEMKEVIRLISIERKLKWLTVTPEEADFVRRLAEKKRLPRAEYVFGCMNLYGIGVEADRVVAMKYLARSSRHGSYELQIKIAYIYHIQGEFNKIRKCLEKALQDCKRM